VERSGYEHHGMSGYEFEPTPNRPVLEATVRRVAAALAAAFARKPGLRTCVVVLPYEISSVPEALPASQQPLGGQRSARCIGQPSRVFSSRPIA
jgi:hypothetical protein